jgi:hypothetical protein
LIFFIPGGRRDFYNFLSNKKTNDWDADERRFSGCDQFKSPLTPKRGKGQMIHRIPINYLSSLWKGRPGGISGKAFSNHQSIPIL